MGDIEVVGELMFMVRVVTRYTGDMEVVGVDDQAHREHEYEGGGHGYT